MPAASLKTHETAVPLCVDLDGTVILTDVLWESLVLLVKRRPLLAFALPFWLMRGRAYLKRQIAARVEINPATLPYHEPFIGYLREKHAQGRQIILVTAADRALADRVAAHLGLFSEVIASNGTVNVRGHTKGRLLAERFGSRGFDYAGNSSVDLPVWAEARQAIVVNAGEGLAQRARRRTEVGRVFSPRGDIASAVFHALRPHQWIKNLIVFVPLLTAHELTNASLLGDGVQAFVAFCLCASGAYVLNDLLDLEADRRHESKRRRPFASGELPLPVGLVLCPVLLMLGVAVGWRLSWNFATVLLIYLVLTTSYSWGLKQLALLDVFFLAGLYTIRLIGGQEATGIAYSFWLLAFSMFIFLSLALVKRFTELQGLRLKKQLDSVGRGYTSNDFELVAMLGIASGYMAVLVMALYVNSLEVHALYQNPDLLLLMCPLLLFWISRVWFTAHRGRMHDDPIVFALKDSVSYVIGALALLVLWLATGHLGGPAGG